MDEKLYNFNAPEVDLKELIHLQSYRFEKDINFEEGYDPEVKAELLLNFVDKLEKLNILTDFYKSAIDCILNELPENMILETTKGKVYKINKKYCDKFIEQCYHNCVKEEI